MLPLQPTCTIIDYTVSTESIVLANDKCKLLLDAHTANKLTTTYSRATSNQRYLVISLAVVLSRYRWLLVAADHHLQPSHQQPTIP